MVYRQPFPGPGLGVRCPGTITRERLEAVRESDAILREEFDKNGLAEKSGSTLPLCLSSDLLESKTENVLSSGAVSYVQCVLQTL